MASFDIIEAAGQGYRQIWAERQYLARLAFIPVMVKFICLTAVAALDLQTSFIRQALISLPYYFTEGWMLAHVVRFVYLGQRWPSIPTGNNAVDEMVLRERFRGVMAGTIVYVLICMLRMAVMGWFVQTEGVVANTPPEQVSPLLMLSMLVATVAVFWGVRLGWLFMPAALNYPMKNFLRALGGMQVSLYMIGLWLVCVVPLTFVFQLIVSEVAPVSKSMEFILVLGQTVVSTMTVLITTAVMCWGIRQIMMPDKKKPPGARRR
ncbi:MAG: hypothetical protein KKA05_03300 [Alphaproteobacteria bacterium]|nr:hypothetical protein [Alphaproteobacteria bacterium]